MSSLLLFLFCIFSLNIFAEDNTEYIKIDEKDVVNLIEDYRVSFNSMLLFLKPDQFNLATALSGENLGVLNNSGPDLQGHINDLIDRFPRKGYFPTHNRSFDLAIVPNSCYIYLEQVIYCKILKYNISIEWKKIGKDGVRTVIQEFSLNEKNSGDKLFEFCVNEKRKLVFNGIKVKDPNVQKKKGPRLLLSSL